MGSDDVLRGNGVNKVSAERRWVRAAAVEEIPDDGMVLGAKVEGLEIALFNWNRTFYALENHCPHMGFPLTEGILQDGIVICGWHGWRVRLEDGGCPGKTLTARTYPCEVRGDDLFVEVPVIP